MKKLKLKAEHNFDFHLFGLISYAKDYTVSWSIGNVLGISLKRIEDLKITIGITRVMIGCYQFESNFVRYSLICNKILNSHDQTVKHLVPSLAHFNYFLKIEELEEIDEINSLFGRLRDAQKIESIAKLDISNIKERESLLF